MREYNGKYKEKKSNIHSKIIRVEKGLFLNYVIEFECIYARRGFQNIEDLS
jgi:hypothetical protein